MSIKLKDIYSLFLITAIASLCLACVVEYIFEYIPCTLCVYQRFPYLIFMIVSIIGLSSKTWKTGLFYLAAAVICSIILAGYHTGIERGIFELSDFCKPLVPLADNLSVSDFKNMLYSSTIPLCNKPALIFLGFSMTEWNLLLNLGLFIILTATIILNNKNAKTIF